MYYLRTVRNTTNIRAEIISLLHLLLKLTPTKKYTVYIDCKSIINCLDKKTKLITNNFKNKKGKTLSNADLYEKKFNTIGDNVVLKHIKGHMPTKQMNSDNKKFGLLDRFVRKCLRKKIKLELSHQKN